MGRCPTCKAAVGGQAYNRFVGTGLSAEQVGEAELRDDTKTGHCLGPVPIGFQRPRPERSLGQLQVAMTQFILHASMAIGEICQCFLC